MAPTLQDDDLVLVDKLKQQPRAGNILVIRIDETVSCKRIQELPGHRFKIMSDNQAYESFEIPADEEGFEIIGQVIWFGRNL
jgi:phage repressor protein C with HTH and peptisase S24 domain